MHSIAGLHARRARRAGARSARRTTRSPPPGWSAAAACPTPGEATLAHHGVLFLDELSEFTRPALEALRQPLEDGRVTIVRAQRVMVFPTRVHARRRRRTRARAAWARRACRCTAADLARHQRRLSGPLLDRIDVSVTRRPAVGERRCATQAAPPSASVRERVVAARERQTARLARHGLTCNAQLDAARCCASSRARRPSAQRALYELHDRNRLSARGHGRILRVARTVADLAGERRGRPDHILQAAALRLDDQSLPRLTRHDALERRATRRACGGARDLIAALAPLARRRVAPALGARGRARAARRGARSALDRSGRVARAHAGVRARPRARADRRAPG